MNKIFPSPYSDLSIPMLRNIHTKCIFITLPHTCCVLYICSLFAHINPLHINYGYCAKLCCCFCLANHCHKYACTHTHTQLQLRGVGGWFELLVSFETFQHTKFFDPKLFLFCTCEYYISSIHSYHNMILIIPMHSQIDRQPNTGGEPNSKA